RTVTGVQTCALPILACVAITMSAMAAGLSATRAAAVIQRLVLLAVAAGLMGSFQFRPQLFTFAMLGILMAILAAEVYVGRVKLWPLVPMFAIWANFHAGCAVGIAALLIFAAFLGVQEFRNWWRLRRSLE